MLNRMQQGSHPSLGSQSNILPWVLVAKSEEQKGQPRQERKGQVVPQHNWTDRDWAPHARGLGLKTHNERSFAPMSPTENPH